MNIQLNEEILNFLLEYRSQHPEITFATRVKNSKNKLDEGYWFQGTENYIFVGFYKLGDSKSKTKTIGFVIELRDGAVVNNHISIVYPMDLSEQVVLLHKRIKDKINSLNILQLKETWKDKRYEFIFENTDWKENLSLFLDKIQPVIDTEIRALHFEKEMFIGDDIFKQNIFKITSVKSTTDYENLLKLLRRIGQDASQKYFDYATRLMANLNVSEGDVRVSYTCQGFKRLAIVIGHRYCFVYILDDSMGMNWHFILQEKVQKENIQQREVFKETNGVISAYYQTTNDDTNIGLLFDGIFDASKFELERTNKSHNRKSNLEVFEKAIFDEEFKKQLFAVAFDDENTKVEPMTQKDNMNPQPLNQILYGPPGTGKTYSTIELAYRAIKGDSAGYEVAKQWFKTELAKSEDRQLDFITFHQNYSYEDFVMGIKPDLNENDGLSFNRHEGIFYKICQRALKNYEDSQKPIEVIEQEKGLEELFDSFKNSVAEALEDNGLYSISDAVNIIEVREDAFVYLGHNWNHNTKGIQMKFRDIIFLYKDESAKDRKSALLNSEISGLAKQHISWYFTMVKKFRSFVDSQKLPSTITTKKISLQNYVIIIDEINRANISRVFGELITLIEEDKRWGNDHAMEVRLPDGHTKFTVPKNLYIIGTMNTADKSIALLDIALRRRFEFTALYPDSSKVSPKYKTFFEALNEQIIAKKGIDFTIGHSYFMAKDGEELDFVKTMNKKVIPLLNEYFYNAKSNKEVAELVEKAIAKAELSNTIVPNDFQLLIQ